MTRQDPQASSGATTCPPVRVCECGLDELLHELVNGVRRACTASGSTCKRFRPVAVVEQKRCEVCGAPMSPEEFRRLVERGGLHG